MPHDHQPATAPDQPHDHDHGTGADEPTWEFTPEFWDARYAGFDRMWSGNPNVRLVEQVADLAPGTALDVGSGEGADALWLAERGWTVTATDISQVALDRAAAHVATQGDEVAGRITWRQADLLTWEPPAAAYDLVTAQFMHLPEDDLAALHRRLAAAVRPGGTLLVVGHHPSDLHTGVRHGHAEMMPTAEVVARRLDHQEWEVVVAETQAREGRNPENGEMIPVEDAVVRARRR